MKLTALRLHNVKRFGGHGIAIEGIGDGVNVLSAANEHGKSTAFEALHALFFQPHTSTGKMVQLLRPYSGGNPLIEADIETADRTYRLTKQFHGGKRAHVLDLTNGRLVAQADEAEAFIAELTRGGSAGPAGLLWVRQGITGIEPRSNKEEESDKRVRETLLSSVQGEVEALTGGRRMAEILSRCEDELFRLVTATLRPKTGGRYASAIDERDRLAAEDVRLGNEVKLLREALDKRRAARARLADLEETNQQSERRAAILAAEAAFEAAKSHGEALKVAEAEVALLSHRLGTATQQLEAYRLALARREELQKRFAEAQQQRDAALVERGLVTAKSDTTKLAVELAENDERELRDLLARLDAAMRARDASERLGQVREQLKKAEAARDSVEQTEATLAALAIPAKTMTQLAELELDLVALRAAQQATLPTLRMQYLPGQEGAASIAGVPLGQGHEQNFADALFLDIAGIGQLTLRSNRPLEGNAAIEAAERKRDALLASSGVPSIAAARERQSRAQEKTRELELARQRLVDSAPQGIAQLHALIAQLTTASADGLELKGDPEQARLAHAAAEHAVTSTRNSAREVQPQLSQAANKVVEAETALAILMADIAAVDGVLGPQESRAERERILAEAQSGLGAAHAEAEAHAASLRPLLHDLAATDATLRRLRSVEAATTQEAGHLRVTLADLNGQIHARADGAVEETWQETQDALAAANASVERFRTEVAVLERLRQSLVSARSQARDLYLKPVVSELRPLLGLLFDDISIVFDEHSLLPQTVRRNGQDEEVDRLSGGMREQLSILTRLAFARLLARDGKSAPVILDDALVYSDDDRIERMFDALHQQARGQQILVFSCRQRAFAKLGGNVLQMQPWTPTP